MNATNQIVGARQANEVESGTRQANRRTCE